MIGKADLNYKTLIVLSPAFPANESEEQSPWLPAKQALIRALNRNFPTLEIIIITFHYPTDKTEYLWHGNRVIPLGNANKRRGQSLILWYSVFKKLYGFKKSKNLAGIISFWCFECCLVGSYFSRLYKVKHLCWISGQDARKSNHFVKRIRPKAGELVAMSDFLAEEFYKNHGIFPKYLIPDAIDTSLFTEEDPERSIDILGAGNLVPLKRYEIFVEVVAALKNKGLSINAVLCGNGTEEQNLKNQISINGLENIISLTGLIGQKEVLAHMKKTKIMLHTSEYEGFGNVCIEALYAGAHVISFTKPMNEAIPHWHIVATKEEMIIKAFDILQNDQTEYTPVLPFDMNDSAKAFMAVLAS